MVTVKVTVGHKRASAQIPKSKGSKANFYIKEGNDVKHLYLNTHTHSSFISVVLFSS